MNKTKLAIGFIGDHNYVNGVSHVHLTVDGVVCSIIAESGKRAIYCDGVRIGWVVERSDNKYGKRKSERSTRKPKPNKGPIPRQQKWKQ